jgi:hypothetical protein
LAIVVAVLVVAASLPFSSRIAHAFPTAQQNFNSLGCGFTGDTGAYSTVGYSNTSTGFWDTCASASATYLDYKIGSYWFGPYWAYQYSPPNAASYVVNFGVSATYSGHQICTSGDWQQVENLINFP